MPSSSAAIPTTANRMPHRDGTMVGTPPQAARGERSTMARERYDVIIIGSGPGGATMAWRLAKTGKRILLLERGDYLRASERIGTAGRLHRCALPGQRNLVRLERGELPPRDSLFRRRQHKMYGAVLFRLRKEDFGEIRHKAASRRPGRSAMTNSSRTTGGRGTLPGARPARRGSDRPPAPKPYAHPPVSHEPRIQELHDAFQREGHHPFHLPLGILLEGRKRQAAACAPASAAMPSTAIPAW